MPVQPIAILGAACRLPCRCSSLDDLWDALLRGDVALNEPPATRFDMAGHFDGSRKPRTMRSPGGMFIEHIDPADIDAQFFGLSGAEATAMDPQQRQLLEVVYEALENACVPLHRVNGSNYGCFMGSFACDYADIQSRDPQDRSTSTTVGIGRAMLSNRISHFLNIKGPSMTIDTACSGSMQSLELACKYLDSDDVDGAIVGAANLYLSPEHNQDVTAMKGAHSLSGKCHAFDIKADGYIKSEAVNAIVLKRLADAIRDGDPVRAVIRGWGSTSDGWTPGIASPSASAQALAAKKAYLAAGIQDMSLTGYLECHGTGTQAGDPIEIAGVAEWYSPPLASKMPLRIGSVKANIGHSEPASGLTGLLKCVLALEKGLIPGNPTFETPNPSVDFDAAGVWCSKTASKWPPLPLRRASINSFGYGGSNTHIIVDQPTTQLVNYLSSVASPNSDPFACMEKLERPKLLVLSANNQKSLTGAIERLKRHLLNPAVFVKLNDLAHTLSECKTHHFFRAACIVNSPSLERIEPIFGKKWPIQPRIGFVFTGQGAQWPQMGKDICEAFPQLRQAIEKMDCALQTLSNPPKWSIFDEITQSRSPEHMRKPIYSQTLVTALQILLLQVFESWGVTHVAAVGHSSGEIAAAFARGHLTLEQAVQTAYLRGLATESDSQAKNSEPFGMLAVGLAEAEAQAYIDGSMGKVQIACINSPASVTMSGPLSSLEAVRMQLQSRNIFSRLLQVDRAYHSPYMEEAGQTYIELLENNAVFKCRAGLQTPLALFSTVTASPVDDTGYSKYWKDNMTSPVRFKEAVESMMASDHAPNFLIEIGPSAALAGPVKQIIAKTMEGSKVEYAAALSRGPKSSRELFKTAGRLFTIAADIDLSSVNRDLNGAAPRCLVDLPNYAWHHETKYWHESLSSRDWRFKKFVTHDLLGSKILGSSWHSPSWNKKIRPGDLPWLRDHALGNDIVFPAAGYIAMAVEAVDQTLQSTMDDDLNVQLTTHQKRVTLRDVKFQRALILEDKEAGSQIQLSFNTFDRNVLGQWIHFTVSSFDGQKWVNHCSGKVRVDLAKHTSDESSKPSLPVDPIRYETSAALWYKAMKEAGYSFGKAFQKQVSIECFPGQLSSRSVVDLTPPESLYQESRYFMHPACLDGCFQSAAPALWRGWRTAVSTALVPTLIDQVVITESQNRQPLFGLASASARFTGVGRRDSPASYCADIAVQEPVTGQSLLELRGLHFGKLDSMRGPETPELYMSSVWRPDVTFVSSTEQWTAALERRFDAITEASDLDHSDPSLAGVFGMLSHKNPQMKVLEVGIDLTDPSSMWLEESVKLDSTIALRQLCCVLEDPKSLLQMKGKYEGHANTNSTFELVDAFLKSPEDLYDLIIVQMPANSSENGLAVYTSLRQRLVAGGHVLVVESSNPTIEAEKPLPGLNDICRWQSWSEAQDPAGCVKPLAGTEAVLIQQFRDQKITLFQLKERDERSQSAKKHVQLFHLLPDTDHKKSVRSHLRNKGWEVSESSPGDDIPAEIKQDCTLVADDLDAAPLTDMSPSRWSRLKQLLQCSQMPILWLTRGAAMRTTRPNSALIAGFARTVRQELPQLNLTLLDLDPRLGEGSWRAMDQILAAGPHPSEHEFAERAGVVYIPRVRIDSGAMKREIDRARGRPLEQRPFHESKTTCRLMCEQVGSLDSLHYVEISDEEEPLEGPDFVEVTIVAAGLNFKDIAISMGIVPGNETEPGLEGAGLVRRVGSGCKAQKFRPGDRVVVLKRGVLANRVQVSVEGVHHIPDWMSFEAAATMPCVYEVCIHGLFDLAKLRVGQTVLIHSAAGGVGLAALQLCRASGADIFATAGTPEKRAYLAAEFGLPPQRILSSRTEAFADEVLAQTHGRGADVVLNSLTGDLLRESWRCVAARGTLVEIGKRDIVGRGSLPLGPFDRNASFRAIDMSHWSVGDDVHAEMLRRLFELVDAGKVGPVSPITRFPFDRVQDAFRYMRSGAHMGKVVITNGDDAPLDVQVRPFPTRFELKSDAAYLIVGGLRGLCGSLAVYMAGHGARNLVIMSRSGAEDKRSRKAIEDLKSLGCHCTIVCGDVSRKEDVQMAFRMSPVPIRGVVHGAMVLRDRILEAMSEIDFNEATTPKVQGTWNLHDVSLESGATLDFFTLLSSLSGVVGQKSQANYAAAGTFQDAFASYRRGLGLAACAVDLGVIEDVGYISEREELAARLDRATWISGITEARLQRILRASILGQKLQYGSGDGCSAQLIVGLATPKRETDELPQRDARFRSLVVSHQSPAGEAAERGVVGSAASQEVQAVKMLVQAQAEHGVVLGAVVDVVSAQVGRQMGLVEAIEPAKDFTSYGLDSLAAMEIRNWLVQALGVEVTTLEISSATSLFALCERIVDRLRAG